MALEIKILVCIYDQVIDVTDVAVSCLRKS